MPTVLNAVQKRALEISSHVRGYALRAPPDFINFLVELNKNVEEIFGIYSVDQTLN